jgi:hypothetical protein
MVSLLVVGAVFAPLAASGFFRRRKQKKGRRLPPAALPEEALVNVWSSTNLSPAASAAKPIIPVLAKGGIVGGE